MRVDQPHLSVVSNLLKSIYTRKLAPGEKLPPLRKLIEDTGVDHTSVRIALKHLETMNLLEIKRGDGVYVKDFRKNAGLDFLSALFMYEQMDKEAPVTDEYLAEEIFEFIIALMPEVFRMAIEKFSIREFKTLAEITEEEMAAVGDIEKSVELEVLSQDLLAEAADNIMVTLIFNSSHLLREKVTELFVRSIGEESLREFILVKKEILREYLTGSAPDQDATLIKFRQSLTKHRQAIRKFIADGYWAAAKQSLV